LNLHPGYQFTNKKRFDYVIVGAQLQPDDAVSLRRLCREENDWNLRELRISPDPAADLEPVGIGQHDVEDD